jgi:ornithine cyclodeaminase
MNIIDEQAIKAAVKEPEALASAEVAFRAMAEDRVQLPPPMGLDIPEVNGEVHVKSAYLRGAPIFAVKIASGFYQNVAKGLPSGAGLILVFDSVTGFPQMLLDDKGYLTDLRTAAAGALAARLLAPEELGQVTVLGSGIQARYQLRALADVRSWDRTVAWSRNRERLDNYCKEMEAEFGRPCTPAATADAALRGADLIITATASREPLFDVSSLPNHATVIAVGSDGPEKRELPTGVLARAGKIVVDRLSQCLALGELHHGVEEGVVTAAAVHGELGEILAGGRPGREGEELIICDLTGVGAQDAAIAEVAWRRLT